MVRDGSDCIVRRERGAPSARLRVQTTAPTPAPGRCAHETHESERWRPWPSSRCSGQPSSAAAGVRRQLSRLRRRPPPRRSSPADITGSVKDLSVGTGGDSLPVLLVVAAPGSTSSVDRASVRVKKDTVVWTAEGVRGDAADLAEGEQVGVWFSGPVAESYPVQASAGVVMVLLSD